LKKKEKSIGPQALTNVMSHPTAVMNTVLGLNQIQQA